MMNPEPPHNFEQIEKPEDAKPGWPVFRIGEEVTLHGAVLRVRKITARDVVLRPVGMQSARDQYAAVQRDQIAAMQQLVEEADRGSEIGRLREIAGAVEDYIAAHESDLGAAYVRAKREEMFRVWRQHCQEPR